MPLPVTADRVTIRPCGRGFAFASIVVDGWSISGIRVRDGDGVLHVEWPCTESAGSTFPVCVPPPGLRERLEADITAAYRRSTGR